MTRSLVLTGGAVAAVLWLARQPAYLHDTPHKQAAALIAICVPFLALDIIVGVRRRRRASRQARPAPAPTTQTRAGAGRW